MRTAKDRAIVNTRWLAPLLTTAVAALVLLALGGCRSIQRTGQSPSGPKMYPVASDWPRALSDDLGNTVTFKEAPQRLVTLSPNLTEIIFLVGAGEQLVGRTDFCDYPPEALDKPSIGGIINPSLEKLVSRQPDLVLAARGVDMAFLDRLGEMNIPVLAYDPQTLDDVVALVQRLGQLTGHDQQGAEAADKLAKRKVQVEANSHRWTGVELRVLFIVSREPLFVAGVTSFINDVIRTCGARNAIAGLPHVDQHRPWPQVSREAIIAADPQLIIAQTHGAGGDETSAGVLAELRATPAWREVAAVHTGQVYTINDDLVARPGPRLFEGLEQISQLLSEAAAQYVTQSEESPGAVLNTSALERQRLLL